jgi:SulP family sulfate permease
MIGQSMINIKSGGRGRLSGISSGVFLLIIILFASSLIEQIPVAALTGVMFMVVIGTFAWPSLKILPNIPRADAFVIILVSAITVWQDLAIAVFVGVIVSALVFAWEKSKAISAVCSETDMGSKIYEIHGPLFFGSTTQFQRLFTPSEDKEDIIIDFINSRVYDHSGIEAIKSLSNKYQQAGKTLHLRHLSPECIGLLEKAGELVELNLLEDPSYHIADDNLA